MARPSKGYQVEHLSDKDILFDILRCILRYEPCSHHKSLPSIKVFNSKIKMTQQLETMIAKSNNK